MRSRAGRVLYLGIFMEGGFRDRKDRLGIGERMAVLLGMSAVSRNFYWEKIVLGIGKACSNGFGGGGQRDLEVGKIASTQEF